MEFTKIALYLFVANKNLLTYLWYRNENSNMNKLILNKLGAKTSYTYILKLLFAAAEIIRRLDQGKELKNISTKN